MISAPFIIGLVLAGLTAVALPYYCILTYPGKNNTTLIYKMCLSGAFFVTALLSLTATPFRPAFLIVMLFGFFSAVIGDFFLGRSDKMKIFVIGSAFFAVAHILYVVALSLAAKRYTPGVRWFNGMEIGIYLAIICIMLIVFVLRKPPFHKLILAMFVYLCIIALMVTKSLALGIRLFASSPATILLPLGSLFFICSDYTLGMMRFNMHKRTKPFKAFSTCSYFVAQMLMVLSLYALIQL